LISTIQAGSGDMFRAPRLDQRGRNVGPLEVLVASGCTAEVLPPDAAEEVGTIGAVELAAPVRQLPGLFLGAEETGLEQRRPLEIAAGIAAGVSIGINLARFSIQ
jgi:hypothetical protein